MATDPELFPLMDRVTAELREHGTLGMSRLTELASEMGQEKLLNHALRFLVDRDEILLDVECQAIHARRNVCSAVQQTLEESTPRSIAAIAEALPYGYATVCDALGWMEREGRLRIHSDEEVELR